MSSSTRTPLELLVDHAESADGAVLVAAPRAVAFWTAVALPVAYAPLLWNGLVAGEVGLLVALLALNALAFLLGHGHLSDASTRSEEPPEVRG